ncbi:hypothetical protein GCM10023237_66580 [Streptomyces coeruleoprunus]
MTVVIEGFRLQPSITTVISGGCEAATSEMVGSTAGGREVPTLVDGSAVGDEGRGRADEGGVSRLRSPG